MDERGIKELRQLVDEVLYSRTKTEAQNLIRRLEFVAAGMKGSLDSYLAGKLGEVVVYAKEASGKAKNKEHWISCVEQCWYVFESRIKRSWSQADQ